MNRRFGESLVRGVRYRIRPGVYAILPRDGRVLVTHQSDPVPEFQLPGGGVDPGESPLRALHREVLEETGWKIAAPRRVGAFRRFVYMPEYDLWAEKICTVYFAQPIRAVCEPLEEGHIAVWTSFEFAAEQLGNEGDRHFLQQFISASGSRARQGQMRASSFG